MLVNHAFPIPPGTDEALTLARMARWNGRARTLGGWVWRSSNTIYVTLPEEVPVRGGAPMAHLPCNRG